MRIQNNIMALNSYRNLSNTSGALSKNLEKLSSGFRINKAADDAAGLVISQNLRAQVSGLKVATRNAQDAISVIQTAEGALQEVSNMLQRMRDLAVQAGNTGVTDANARSAANLEVSALLAEIDRIANTTRFADTYLLSGSYSNAIFQVGAQVTDAERISVTIASQTTTGLSINGISVGSLTAAQSAASALDAAIDAVATTRGRLGAIQNRLESTIANLSVNVENLAASESRIRDTDMASEMTQFTKNQILQQAGTAMLAQANMVPQSVIKLLG